MISTVSGSVCHYFNTIIKSNTGETATERIEYETKLLDQYQSSEQKGPKRKKVAVKQDEVDNLLAEPGF